MGAIRSPSPPLSVSVGTSSVLILDSPGAGLRTDLVITNTSSAGQVIALAFGADAIASQGIVLQPTASIAFSRSAGYEVPQEQIRAIASAASGSVAVWVRSE